VSDAPLIGKVALVTGAARRIGRSIALRLASEGADVIVNYRRSKSEAEEVVAQILATGRRAMPIHADVAKRVDVLPMFAAVESEFGRLDILVNNAGMFFPAKFEDLTEEQWDTILNANLKSQFLCSQTAAPDASPQRARPDYQFRLARRPARLARLYALLRLESRCNHADALPGARARARNYRERHRARHDLISRRRSRNRRRLHPTRSAAPNRRPEDIDDAVMFLAQSPFITGQVIVVDGGRTLT